MSNLLETRRINQFHFRYDSRKVNVCYIFRRSAVLRCLHSSRRCPLTSCNMLLFYSKGLLLALRRKSHRTTPCWISTTMYSHICSR